MTTNKTIYIIRHGETEYNKLGIIQGSGIDSDLNETGILQAEHFYKAYGHIPFSKIYISKLKRTYQTILPFVEAGIPHESMEELNEINWGIFEGELITPEYHKEYLKVIHKWQDGFLDIRIEGGESPLELWNRQAVALTKIMSRPEEETILIAMHGRAMKSFICMLSGVSQSRMEDFQHTNLCLYLAEYSPEKGYKLMMANDTGHLIG